MVVALIPVTFTDTSTGNVSSSWNFGDGTPKVTGKSVSHTYNTAGTYRVTLTITSANGETSSCFKDIQVVLSQQANNGIIVISAIGITAIVTAYLLYKKQNIAYGVKG